MGYGEWGVAEGRLIGGNLNTMYGFIGSSYFPEVKEGDILLIEDCIKTASVVEKNFAMLKVHGVFEKVAGIILGKHELYDDSGTETAFRFIAGTTGWSARSNSS